MAGPRKDHFKPLLDGYKRIRASQSRSFIQTTGRLLETFKANHEKNLKVQKTTADDFNLLDTLQISGDETRHSMLLAWLLDWDATHAQGNLGFSLFLKHLGLNGAYAETPYRVELEVSGTESRIDVAVLAPRKFIIYIENKIYSDEGDNQTIKEWSDLKRRRDALEVKPKDAHGFFLTLDGHEPASRDFKAISWQQIADMMDEFSQRSKAEPVSLFAAHYAEALRRMTFEMDQIYDDENQVRA